MHRLHCEHQEVAGLEIRRFPLASEQTLDLPGVFREPARAIKFVLRTYGTKRSTEESAS